VNLRNAARVVPSCNPRQTCSNAVRTFGRHFIIRLEAIYKISLPLNRIAKYRCSSLPSSDPAPYRHVRLVCGPFPGAVIVWLPISPYIPHSVSSILPSANSALLGSLHLTKPRKYAQSRDNRIRFRGPPLPHNAYVLCFITSILLKASWVTRNPHL